MRTLALSGLLAFSTSALAGVDAFVGSVDEVVISGTVTVPLVADPDSENPSALVGVTSGDSETVVAIAIGGREAVIVVPQALVDDLELEKKSKKDKLGGTIDWVDIDSLVIGDLELKGVRAMVQGSGSNGTIAADEVRIGMGALPELSYAILPSQGVVKFAPAAEGAALVSEVGGTAIPYTEAEWSTAKFGKTKKLVPFRTLVVDVKIGGQDVSVALEPGSNGTAISPDAGVALEGGKNSGDTWHYWLDAEIAGHSTSGWFYSNSTLDRGSFAHQGIIGADLLAGMDIAVDRGSMTVAIAPASEINREDVVDRIIERAEKELEEALAELDGDGEEGEAAEESEEAEEGAADPARAGAYATIAGVYERFHKNDKALESWKAVIEADDSSCTNWMSYGSVQLKTGDVDGALASFEKSSEMYHAWWDNDLETRKEMKALAAKDKSLNVDENGESTDPKEVPGACHVADGHVAQVLLVKGDLDGVEQAYRKHLDLDPDLALAYGNAALMAGEHERAHEPLRQAIRLESSPDPVNRMALGVAYSLGDDHASASELFKRAAELDEADPMAVALWFDAVRQSDGEAAAVDEAKAWAMAHPDNTAAHLAWVQAAQAAGDASEASKAAQAVFDTSLGNNASDATLQATYARFLVTQGKLDDAAAAADKAVALDAGLGLAWLAKADVASAQGDADAAAGHLKTAGTVASGHPAYALLLSN